MMEFWTWKKLGTTSNGREAEVKSQDGDTSNIAGACRPCVDKGVTTKALWRTATALGMMIAAALALATGESQASRESLWRTPRIRRR